MGNRVFMGKLWGAVISTLITVLLGSSVMPMVSSSVTDEVSISQKMIIHQEGHLMNVTLHRNC